MLNFSRLAICALLVSGLLRGQFGSGIQGTVVDGTSAVMPGVRVLVTNVDTGVTREALTSELGLYRVPSLSSGTYNITAAKPGFIGVRQDSVVVSVDEIRKVDFSLQVGNLVENVTVHERPTILETEEGRVSATISRTQITELPIPNRNVFNLMVLQPGITGRSMGIDNVSGRSTANVNANGTRSDSNSYNIDGMSVNSTSRGGASELTPSVDSVEEVRVVTNNYSAVEGRNMGAHVDIISKTGTNRWHGLASEYFTNNTLTTRNFFDAGVPVSRRNQFSGALGGPIIRNRTFFHFTYEGLQQGGTTSRTATVETPQFVNFVTRTRPNSIAAKLLTQFRPVGYPTENIRDIGSPLPGVGNWSSTPDGIPDIGTVRYTPDSTNQSNLVTGRIDGELRPGKDRLYGYYYEFRGVSHTYPVRPSLWRWNPTTGHTLNLNETHIFTPNTINEFHLAVLRYIGTYTDPNHKEVPPINITGVGNGFQDTSPFPGGWFPTEYMLKDMVSWSRGAHSLKFGGEIRRTHNNLKHTASYIPNYTFASILDFADDDAQQMVRTVNPVTGLPATTDATMRQWEAGFFLQDDWKVRRNLTINIGLRYEYFGPFTDGTHRLRNFVYGPGSTTAEQIANGKSEVVGASWKTNHRNFAPRFGTAWDIGGKGRNVIRAGYGISYDRFATVYPAGYRNSPPLIAQVTVGRQFGTPLTYSLGDPSKPYLGYPLDASLAAGLDSHNGIKGLKVTLASVDVHFPQPYTHNWFFGIQRALPGQVVVETSYLGSAGHHLVNITDVNRYRGDLLDGRLDKINTSFSTINQGQSNSNSIYHGGTVSVRRHFQKGLTFAGAYTYGKVLTDAEAEQQVTNFLDVENRALDRSAASFDVPQRLSLSGVWDLPLLRGCGSVLCRLAGRWQISGYAVLEKGLPLGIFTTAAFPRGDFNADGNNNDRPNVPLATVARKGYTRSQYLNGMFRVSDFPAPAAGANGNLGRNTFRSPGFARTDLSLAKSFKMTESLTARLRVDAFNGFNHTNLNAPSGDLNNNNFGKVTGAAVPRSYLVSLQIRF